MNAPREAINETAGHGLIRERNDDNEMLTAIYLRVSTEHQTLEQQLLAMKGWLEWQGIDPNNPDQCIVFEEHGKSAFKQKYATIRSRPQGAIMMQMIDDGLIGRLVILDIKRLWRNGTAGVNEVEELQEKGISIVCTMMGTPIDLTTSIGFKQFWNEMGDAQVESMQKAERAIQKQDWHLEQHHSITGEVYGWDKDKDTKQLTPNYEEQAVIAWVEKELNSKHGRSQKGCSEYLNRLGIGPKTIKDNPDAKWHPGGMPRILKSKTQLALKHSIQARYVQHPKLGRIRIGQKQSQPTTA